MLKFFIQIRKKLIEEDNVRKYLFYAVSEIFLVMIGILIAENLVPPEAPGLKGGFSSLEIKTNQKLQTALGLPSLAD